MLHPENYKSKQINETARSNVGRGKPVRSRFFRPFWAFLAGGQGTLGRSREQAPGGSRGTRPPPHWL